MAPPLGANHKSRPHILLSISYERRVFLELSWASYFSKRGSALLSLISEWYNLETASWKGFVSQGVWQEAGSFCTLSEFVSSIHSPTWKLPSLGSSYVAVIKPLTFGDWTQPPAHPLFPGMFQPSDHMIIPLASTPSWYYLRVHKYHLASLNSGVVVRGL